MSNNNNGQPAQWNSRFGYIMVAAGAAIGLGNIWKFPYLAYRGGGGIFLITYIIIIILMAHPMVEMETAIGRFGKSDTVTVYEKINKKWGFVGWIANICTIGINMFYVVVGGWVLKYAAQFIFSGDFGEDTSSFFNGFISEPVEPLIWSTILLAFTCFLLLFGITEIVEKVTKVIMPALFVILIFCAVYACAVTPGAVEGLKYYLLPDFKNFNFKVFADAATQVLFSVGIGWGIFTTLGANIPDSNNLKSDAILVSVCDTMAAILAGFVVIPTAFAGGMEVSKGPALLFDVMAGIYGKLPGGRLIGSAFFIGVAFAVLSSLFTFFEISIRTFEEKLKMGRKKGIIVFAIIVLLVTFLYLLDLVHFLTSSFRGRASRVLRCTVCMTGLTASPVTYYFLLAAYLPVFSLRKSGDLKGYEKELYKNTDHKLSKFDKALTVVVIPLFMVIVLLNVFGFLG